MDPSNGRYPANLLKAWIDLDGPDLKQLKHQTLNMKKKNLVQFQQLSVRYTVDNDNGRPFTSVCDFCFIRKGTVHLKRCSRCKLV